MISTKYPKSQEYIEINVYDDYPEFGSRLRLPIQIAKRIASNVLSWPKIKEGTEFFFECTLPPSSSKEITKSQEVEQ